MTQFNAAKARTKYALPVWVDSFLRDTMGLSTDEIGSYNLLLWAMWGRESCDLPDDDKKLARIARATPQTWKRRIRPAMEAYFDVKDGLWTNTRLRKEADKTERFLAAQSARKSGSSPKNEALKHHCGAQSEAKKPETKSDKLQKTQDVGASVDTSKDVPADLPTQETKNPSTGGGCGGDAQAREANPRSWSGLETYRERLLKACGADPVSGMTRQGGVQIGLPDQMILAHRWVTDLALTEDEVIEEIKRLMQQKRDGPPKTLKYFETPLERLAGNLAEARSKPIAPLPTQPALAARENPHPSRRKRPVKVKGGLREACNEVEDEFELVWEHYPRRVGKAAARRSWAKARGKATFTEIAQPLARWIDLQHGADLKFVPHFSTWLNEERWTDDQSHATNRAATTADRLDRLGAPESDTPALSETPRKLPAIEWKIP